MFSVSNSRGFTITLKKQNKTKTWRNVARLRHFLEKLVQRNTRRSRCTACRTSAFGPCILFWPQAEDNVGVYLAERVFSLRISFRRWRTLFGVFFCGVFDFFMLGFFVAFLFQGTKFKLMAVFSVRG